MNDTTKTAAAGAVGALLAAVAAVFLNNNQVDLSVNWIEWISGVALAIAAGGGAYVAAIKSRR